MPTRRVVRGRITLSGARRILSTRPAGWVMFTERTRWRYPAPNGPEQVSIGELKIEQRAGVGCTSTSSERTDQLSADNNDALVSDADFAEIEAFANDSALVSA